MSDTKLMQELTQHYEMWTEDNRKRMTRKNGWNDITDAYYGRLPNDWPYSTRITDPRVRTTLLEKNARLLNSKLRGTLVPREGTDVVKAQINNAILNYQWETANDGGSMLVKMSVSDMDARLYASKFALIKWRYETNADGEVLFDGNEFIPLDIRDCGLEPVSTHVRDAKWFQHRSWEALEDLENQADTREEGGFQNIAELKKRVEEKLGDKKSATRTTEYVPRGKTLRSLEDRTGEDMAYPVVKLVTEYRRDRWITFTPDYDLILRDIPNPYDHNMIPIAQLRYYHVQDDPYGESEVESVIPLWIAIQATICGYMDEVILKMRPPLKILEGQARIETIVYGPEEQWLVDRQDAVEEMRTSGDSLAFFQTTYQALVSAFNVAMGDLSQGVSNFGPFEDGDKTATEIRATQQQQNTRDQKNQNDLGEFIKDMMMMWLSNNQQFLFSDPEKAEHVIRIVGQEHYDEFKKAGMGEMESDPQTMQMVADIVAQNPDMTDSELQVLYESSLIPKHPVILNPKEKDPSKLRMKPKLRISDVGSTAELSVVPEDMAGTYDYVPDVKSMSLGADQEMMQARQSAMQLLTTNPTVIQLLQQEGFRPNVKELLRSTFEGLGLRDAERFFEEISNEQIQPEQNVAPGALQMGGASPSQPVGGVQGVPTPNIAVGSQPMA